MPAPRCSRSSPAPSRAHAASGPSLIPSADALTFDMHLHPGAFFYKGRRSTPATTS
ncbi:MAG: hypothetical protein IPP20_05260 [Gemmatimonadetes bacterium]|nr:hypothetical protein [Gemmatimonadota bacterium]